MDERDGYFVVKISMRCWAKLVELERQTGLSKEEIVELLIENARLEDVVRLAKEWDQEEARRALRWRG